ncbi:ankyrin repeat-containing domain protein [Stachybotrys elegans]|uniref:Ankyrin repeat-containing domain protein n=1 Tax=Stachybotrys elegans TaxID=80388 RepID=A0A8K0STP0_9HYPO|nr:ankyrin repeat-containing domain protein [Stachybotrys elegans]
MYQVEGICGVQGPEPHLPQAVQNIDPLTNASRRARERNQQPELPPSSSSNPTVLFVNLFQPRGSPASLPSQPCIVATMIEPSIRMRRAIHAGDALLVRRILNSHPSILHNPDASPAGQSNSNLHLAASLGHRDICKVLVDAGHEKPCPALNENHQTALMLAAAAGHTEVVHLLCEDDRTCILRRDIRGRDALMEASKGGHDTVVQLLLTYCPDGPLEAVRRADLEGNTALHFASSNGNLLVLRTLLAAGANVETRNVWSWTPAAYSATVQAEVYLKGLVSEVGKRQQAKKEVDSTRKAAAVRLVEVNEE